MAFTKIRGNNITNYTIETEQLSNTATAAFAKTLAPKILYANVASNNYTILDDAAVNVGGGYIVITGAEFQSGATVLIDTTQASAVSYINSTTLRAQVPAKSAASYNLYVVNPDGGTGLKVAGITYSSDPIWVTTSPLANVTSNSVFSGTFSATGATSYANTTILPTGFNLLSNGYYYGNISVGVETTYSFDIKATDAEAQDSIKTFSLTTVTTQPFTVEYLVVAGGGGGGSSGGPGAGGGGGGGGGFSNNTLTLVSGRTYTISVGAGGSPGLYNGGGPSGSGENSPGSPSYISGPEITTVTSIGGGKGGFERWYSPSPASSGGSGGSGGGGSTTPGGSSSPNKGGNAGLATNSPAQGISGTQGYPGGNGYSPSAPENSNLIGGAGGGGGAGGAGSPGSSKESPWPYGDTSGGPGGAGALWPYTGSRYAGGGGGARFYYGGGTDGTASPLGGGGGNAGNIGALGPAINGSPGTGGGGGGGRFNSDYAGSGGSGVVILAVPTPNYPGSAPGATVTTPPAAPGKTVITFTSSGTYTA